MAFAYVEKVEAITGLESRLGVGTVYDDTLTHKMVAVITLSGGGGFYLEQEQLDEFIYNLSQVDLKI